MPEFSHKNYSNGTLFRRKSLGTALDRQLTDRTAEDRHTVAGNVGPEGLAALEQASDLALAHLDDLYPIAGDPSRVLTPCLEARSPSLVLLRYCGRSHNNDVDVAARSGVAACE